MIFVALDTQLFVISFISNIHLYFVMNLCNKKNSAAIWNYAISILKISFLNIINTYLYYVNRYLNQALISYGALGRSSTRFWRKKWPLGNHSVPFGRPKWDFGELKCCIWEPKLAKIFKPFHITMNKQSTLRKNA